jgi:hypothetical protein
MVEFVGFFTELKSGRSEVYQGNMRDWVRESPGREEVDLVCYLKNGVPVVDIMEAEVDVISGDRSISGSSSLITDGEWVWREDLHYYVDRYHLDLGEGFSGHAKSCHYEVREVSPSEMESIIDEVKSRVLNA